MALQRLSFSQKGKALELTDVWNARLEVPPVLDQLLGVDTRSSCKDSTGSHGERSGIRCTSLMRLDQRLLIEVYITHLFRQEDADASMML